MTRVNVDDIAFMDRRFKLLGGRLAMTWQEALGRCLPVWALAYAKRSAILPAGDIDALAERPGFAAAMLEVDLAADSEGGMYVRGVAARIDFLLIQDAKRDKARHARLAAAGVSLPPGPSPGKRASSLPPGPSPGTSQAGDLDPPDMSPGNIPGRGSYSPDLDPDLDLDQKMIPPARDPAVPSPAPPPQQQLAPPEAQIPERPCQPGPEDRRRARADLRTELELARTHVAAKLGETVNPLLAFDQGIDADLQGQLALATTWQAFDLVTTQARHAIAMAAAETASGEKSLEWFTGAIFQPKNFRRLAAKTATSRAGPRSSAARASTGQPMIRPRLYDDEESA